jgi:hypothetical protein
LCSYIQISLNQRFVSSIGNIEKACEFSTVLADRADLGITETAEQKLKYTTFQGGFFNFFGPKKSFKFLKKYSRVRTKKLHTIKLRKNIKNP